MKVTCENGWEHTDVHIDLDVPYREDYQIHMLSANDITGIVKIKGSGRDGNTRYTYRINGGISMEKQYSMREMKRRDVERFIEDLLGTVEDVVAHLLDPDGIILSPDMIFIEDGRHRFCYLPVSTEKTEERPSLAGAFHQMTEYFVKRLDYHDTEGIFLVYRLHKETMQDGFELRKIIEESRRDETEERKEREERKRRKKTVTPPEENDMPYNAVFDLETEDLETEDQAEKIETIREPPVRYGRIRKVVNRIKNGRWGEWQDLITEMDGHE